MPPNTQSTKSPTKEIPCQPPIIREWYVAVGHQCVKQWSDRKKPPCIRGLIEGLLAAEGMVTVGWHSQHYIQARITPEYLEEEPSYEIEWRDGNDRRHYYATAHTDTQVSHIIQSYVFATPFWIAIKWDNSNPG